MLVEGRDEVMLRICAIEVHMSFWVEDLPLDVSGVGSQGYTMGRLNAFAT
jgi:hypothetical protein